jgi:hypothetical protein
LLTLDLNTFPQQTPPFSWIVAAPALVPRAVPALWHFIAAIGALFMLKLPARK